MVAGRSAGGVAAVPDLSLAIAGIAPGRLGRGGVAGVLLFDTVGLARRTDLIARFFSEELGALDWRADYMRSVELDDLLDGLEDRLEIDQDIEEVYARSELTTTGVDNIDET
jgi:hypothetical protein